MPTNGEVISLADINDGVFSAEVLGKGCGVIPSDNTVTAPFNGTISHIADTKHAIGITSEDGIELLIHVGMDTVEMNGTGFDVLVKNNEKVRCGQTLMTFDRDAIKEAGYVSTIAVVIANTSTYEKIEYCRTGSLHVGEQLMLVHPN